MTQSQLTLRSLFRRVREYEHISRTLAYVIPIAAVSGTVLTFALGLRDIAIVSTYASVPALIASAAYFTSGDAVDGETPTGVLSLSGLRLTVIAYLACQSVSILLLVLTEVRPLSYYLIVSMAAVVILIQILQFDLDQSCVYLILTETCTLMMNIVWSVTFNYHYFFGRTDVFPHDLSVNSLLETHYVTGVFGEYEAFPLWHIFVSFQTQLFDRAVEPLFLFFLTTGIVYAVAIPAVYVLAKRFSFSREVSLIAALCMCIHPWVVFYGMYSLPRSATSFLFSLVLLTLAASGKRESLLFGFLVVAIAIYHTVTLPFIFLSVGVYFVVERFLAPESGTDGYVVSAWELSSIAIVQLTYWLVADRSLITRVIDTLSSADEIGGSGEGGVVAGEFFAAPFHELANYLSFGLLLLFIIFAVIQSSRVMQLSKRGRSVLLTALLLCVVSFPGPALLVSSVTGMTADNILRFGHYTYPFIVIGVAVGIVSAVRTQNRFGSHDAKMVVLLLLFVSTGFLAVSNDFNASDNPAVERGEFYTFYLSESEVESFTTIAARSESEITGDYIACRYLNYPGRSDCNIIQADPANEELHHPSDNVLLLRKGELEDRPLSIYPTDELVSDPPYSNNREYVPRESAVWDGLSEKHKVYDSSDVSAYMNS